MNQQTFTDIEYGKRKRTTKREEFLKIMEEIIPWEEWIEYIRPHYYKGERGRKPRGIEIMLKMYLLQIWFNPRGIEIMLKMYLLQIWFNLSDEMVEDSIYDSYAMRKFMGIDFTREQAPDATTLLKFRRIIEENRIGEKLFNAIQYVLEQGGCIMRGGSIVDATIISSPSSTKNEKKERDPDMHQTKKGGQWYFGMKCHVGADAGSGYVHTIEATAANVHDVTQAYKLIRKDDEVVYGDSGYLGIQKREEIINDVSMSNIDYRINKRPGRIRKMQNGIGKDREKLFERKKSSVRSKIEYVFYAVKNLFGYKKVAYRGISKNLNRLHMLFGCANLLMCAGSGGLRQ